jgi:hypothetical protein
MPEIHDVEDGESVYEKMYDPDVKVGDTIVYHPNNQQGMAKYVVILNSLGEKDLELIESYDDLMGGRRKTRRRKSKGSKRKSIKRKRKSKSSKRKSSKRKSSKRKSKSKM